ncbi:hypothetical protein SCHPADRAFT_892896 [Schizopora paradoxa]|uniref:Uncharacterized protein n=1 Tax=Schizopora paradoxa TaxID=27342 RepID=A0A0H2RDU7_9AGAM|nr:hypothetical protein SCHPADRAFT_892896 [Schizopora paradoxa]
MSSEVSFQGIQARAQTKDAPLPSNPHPCDSCKRLKRRTKAPQELQIQFFVPPEQKFIQKSEVDPIIKPQIIIGQEGTTVNVVVPAGIYSTHPSTSVEQSSPHQVTLQQLIPDNISELLKHHGFRRAITKTMTKQMVAQKVVSHITFASLGVISGQDVSPSVMSGINCNDFSTQLAASFVLNSEISYDDVDDPESCRVEKVLDRFRRVTYLKNFMKDNQNLWTSEKNFSKPTSTTHPGTGRRLSVSWGDKASSNAQLFEDYDGLQLKCCELEQAVGEACKSKSSKSNLLDDDSESED